MLVGFPLEMKSLYFPCEKVKGTLRKCGFSNGNYIEKLIVSEFLEMKRNISDLNSEMFIPIFEDNCYNLKFAQFATLETQ